MSSYRDLDIYKLSFELSIKAHRLSLRLLNFELYEQGSQIRRFSKSVKDQIVEGYGRRRYKADFIKFLVYSQASNDECTGQIETIIEIYPEISEWKKLLPEYDILGKKINKYIQYVEKNWKS
jgi:four helix bundle protein